MKILVRNQRGYKLLNLYTAFLHSITVLTQFCLGNISNEFGATESREVSLKGMSTNFQSIKMLLTSLKYKKFTSI